VRRLGLDAIGVVAKAPNWYPRRAMLAAAPAVRRVLRGASIGYGFSMGGYAVLKYGRLFGLTHGLAISPQVSIDPGDAPLEARWRVHFDATLHAGMRAAPHEAPPTTVVAADPFFEPDMYQLALGGEAPEQLWLPLPFMKHAAVHAFAGTSILASALSMVVERDLSGLRRALRAHRGTSHQTMVWLARSAIARGHPVLGERILARAASLGASPAELDALRATAWRERLATLATARRRSDALAVLPRALAAQGRNVEAIEALRRILTRGRMPVAASLCAAAAERARLAQSRG
jgi:hypothetical protein